MSAFTNVRTSNGVFQVPILNEVECDAEADVEAVLDLTSTVLGATLGPGWWAMVERVMFHLIASGKSGSPSFTIDSISRSLDGTNYETWQSFAPISITANGVAAPVGIALPPGPIQKLRLDSTVTTLSASHKITLKAWLSMVLPRHL